MAYVPGVALLGVLAAGCSTGAGGNANGADSKAGSPTVTPAPPGKYLTLPAPCRAVPRSTLKDLLPGAAELPGEQQDRVFRGSAAVTYDTDRKVGCSWKADAPSATRSLAIDFERVVSYDPAVSDDDRADTVYAKKVKAAGLSSSVTPVPTGEQDGKGEESGKAKDPADAGGTDSATPSPSGSSGEDGGESADGTTGSSGSPDEALPSRLLDDLGDAAFLQDLPKRADSTSQHHTVSVVFRTSNVVVTVRYAEQPALITQTPDARELQEKAQALARKLAETLSE